MQMRQDAQHGKRFARDMRRIREARNLSLDDLHDETKIPLGLIEAFEEQALFDHPQFNRVYLRSFVKTYAQVVDVDEDLALEGLEEALSARYSGLLAVQYLGEEPADVSGAPDEAAEPSDVPASGADGGSEVPGEPSDPYEADTRGPEEPPPQERPSTARSREEDVGTGGGEPPSLGRKEPQGEEEQAARPSFVSTTQDSAAGFEATRREIEAERAGDDAPSPSASVRAGQTPGHMPRSGVPVSRWTGRDIQWILGAGLLIVLGALVWILVSLIHEPEQTATAPVAAEDTTEVAETAEVSPPPAVAAVPVPTLGDTMRVRVVAEEGRVDPIRVTIDDDLRRPYWIEHGDSMTFSPTQRIVLEGLIDSVAVKLEGIRYPTDRRDERGRVVINRDTAQTYFASLRRGR